MRGGNKSGNENLAEGITPCVRGDSLLKILTEAGKFAGCSGKPHNFFRRIQLQCFRQRFFGW